MQTYKTYTLDVNCKIERKETIEVNIPDDIDINNVVNELESSVNTDKIYNIAESFGGYISYHTYNYNNSEIIAEVEGRED